MKKTLSKIALGLFIVAAIAVNAFPVLANSNYSLAFAEDTYTMYDDPLYCSPGYHWSHCVFIQNGKCDVSAQHENCEKNDIEN